MKVFAEWRRRSWRGSGMMERRLLFSPPITECRIKARTATAILGARKHRWWFGVRVLLVGHKNTRERVVGRPKRRRIGAWIPRRGATSIKPTSRLWVRRSLDFHRLVTTRACSPART